MQLFFVRLRNSVQIQSCIGPPIKGLAAAKDLNATGIPQVLNGK
jgi:hypothetical protein